MGFPERIFTQEEVEKARKLIKEGYRHRLTVKGSLNFREKVAEALELVKIAGYYPFLQTYIRSIVEVQGLSQLREAEAILWANEYAVADPLEAAGFFIQKAQQMKDYLEGKLYYDMAEKRAVERRLKFLGALKNRSKDDALKRKCEEALKRWDESQFL
ncbi:MAG: hypothetical protein QW231_03810 [Candidatus Bathyarchaeia archaeon]